WFVPFPPLIREFALSTLLFCKVSSGYQDCPALGPRPQPCLDPELEQLVVGPKREDPGRSCALIVRELELAGRIGRGQVAVSALQRLPLQFWKRDSTLTV